VKKYPGNSLIPSNHKILNSPVNPVPKMKLPPFIKQGGKRKTHRKRSTKRKALRKTRKH
jgi:hypothetical protein